MLSRSEATLLRRLRARKGREAEGLFVAEGVRVVEELVASCVPARLAVVSPSLEETERGRRLREHLDGTVEVRHVRDGELGELSDTRSHQGVLVVAETPATTLESVEPGGSSIALVLDGVQDPGNVGTLARTAAAFGCGLLACLTGTVDPWNPKAVRSSAGALFRLPVVVTGPEPIVTWLRGHGFELLGADAAGTPLEEPGGAGRSALVVGNEGAGLSERVRTSCDRLVAVPMREGTESLNAAVAGGILLYLISRGRR